MHPTDNLLLNFITAAYFVGAAIVYPVGLALFIISKLTERTTMSLKKFTTTWFRFP